MDKVRESKGQRLSVAYSTGPRVLTRWSARRFFRLQLSLCTSLCAPQSVPPHSLSFFSLSVSAFAHTVLLALNGGCEQGGTAPELAGPPRIYLLLLHWFHISFQSDEWSQSWVLLAEHKQETGLTCPQLPLMRSLSKREQVYECFIESASLTCIHPFLRVALWYCCLWHILPDIARDFPILCNQATLSEYPKIEKNRLVFKKVLNNSGKEQRSRRQQNATGVTFHEQLSLINQKNSCNINFLSFFLSFHSPQHLNNHKFWFYGGVTFSGAGGKQLPRWRQGENALILFLFG